MLETRNSDGQARLFWGLTQEIIGAAIEVHRTLGPGFLEKVYETALAMELSDRRIPFRQQANIDVLYKGRVAGCYIADLIVHSEVLVEIKAQDDLVDPNEAQVLNYLRGTGIKVGLLMNFGRSKIQVNRFII